MENKEYYTPIIEELFIGYECEIVGRNFDTKEDGFVKHIITDIPTRLICRTPYLCKESIEELGWEYTGKSIDIWFKKEGVFDMGNFTAYKIVMHYGLEDHRMFIYAEDQGSEYDLFKGVVKSKNELKKLMKDYLNIPI